MFCNFCFINTHLRLVLITLSHFFDLAFTQGCLTIIIYWFHHHSLEFADALTSLKRVFNHFLLDGKKQSRGVTFIHNFFIKLYVIMKIFSLGLCSKYCYTNIL